MPAPRERASGARRNTTGHNKYHGESWAKKRGAEDKLGRARPTRRQQPSQHAEDGVRPSLAQASDPKSATRAKV
jgi:hypothetical protein